MKQAIILAALLVLGTVSTNCTTMIENPGVEAQPDGPTNEEELAICKGDGDAGGACEVSADCDAPMVCLVGANGGVCVGALDPAYTCDNIEGIVCQTSGETCVDGLCVAEPGSCEFTADCSNGFVCTDQQCTPQRDGTVCPKPGPGPALAGTYEASSVLHLRDGLPNVVDGILDVSEKARDIVNGNINLGLGSLVNSIIGGAVANIIKGFVPPWGITIVQNLATLSDVMDTMNIEGTLVLEGQACNGNYRGKHVWDQVTFELNGQTMTVRPEELPGVSTVEDEEFAARYHCGDLLIDRHRVQNTMGTLVRWLLDTTVQVASGRNTVEDALLNIVDCQKVGNGIANACGGICDGAGAGAELACKAVTEVGVNKISQLIDDATVKLALIKLNAVIPVNDDGSLEQGVWYGSLVGGDFLGEIEAARQ